MPQDNGDLRRYGNPYAQADAPARAYRDVRPNYPEQALDWALADVKAGATIADIGAGTGKLTAQLAERGYFVWAIEPAFQMRQEFYRALAPIAFPAQQLLATRGEATGLPSHSCSGVTYGQSWHWLDPAAASAEAARILSPGGVIAILVNQLAVEVPWVQRLSRIMRSGDVATLGKPPQLGAAFSSPEAWSVTWSATVTPEELIQLGATRAAYIRQRAEGKAWMQANLRWYLYDALSFAPAERIELPYHTYVWRAWRK